MNATMLQRGYLQSAICVVLFVWSSLAVDGAAPSSLSRKPTEISLGTTIIALRTKQGVIVAADTRTSQGTMVSNRFADKLSILYQKGPVSCVLCRSGSAADTQYLAEQARWEFQSRALRYGIEPSLSQIAQWLRYVVVNGEYSASLLCVGYDPKEGQGRILSVAQTGALIEEPTYAAAGSGSTFIIGLMDSKMKQLQTGEVMEEDAAIEFVSHLIQRAMARDSGSGGVARILVMNKEGCRNLIVESPSSISLVDAASDIQGFRPATRLREVSGFGSARIY